jgi:hypothetical protein
MLGVLGQAEQIQQLSESLGAEFNDGAGFQLTDRRARQASKACQACLREAKGCPAHGDRPTDLLWGQASHRSHIKVRQFVDENVKLLSLRARECLPVVPQLAWMATVTCGRVLAECPAVLNASASAA